MLSQIIRFYGNAMQGFMGSYLEQNIKTFIELQQRMAAQSKGLYDPKAFGPELWAQFMQGQAPAMQGLMGSYLEQSKKLFVQMQEQMSKQTETVLPGFPGFPGIKR